MTITVTQENIDNGTMCSSVECPIALALIEEFPTAEEISVDLATASVTDKGQDLVGSLPLEAQHFIAAFDQGSYGLKPFSFEYVPQVNRAAAYEGDKNRFWRR